MRFIRATPTNYSQVEVGGKKERERRTETRSRYKMEELADNFPKLMFIIALRLVSESDLERSFSKKVCMTLYQLL